MHFKDPAKYALLAEDFLSDKRSMEINEKDLKHIEKLLLIKGVDKNTVKEIISKLE